MGKSFVPGTMGVVANCDYLNVRKKVGNKEYEVVKGDQLKVGTRVELLAYENGRYKIMYKGKEGYIYEKYVEIDG